MNNYRRLYLLILLLVIVVIPILVWLIFPKAYFLRGCLLAFLPVSILALGTIVNNHFRIQAFREQIHQISEMLEAFDIEHPQPVSFEASPFPIFDELNDYLVTLTKRVGSHFQANKQFTQNASHELQTPLAIIKGHVELLLNSPNLKKKEVDALAIILHNTNRLTKLISALILLSKIESNRYGDVEEVSIQNVLEMILHNFEDIINLQEIKIERQYEGELKHKMSVTLAEILFTNLFQNAIRYNQEEGFISILIKNRTVTIANPGEVLEKPTATLFKRFQRESNVEESLGLGLSIVKSICDSYHIEVRYLHQAGLHRLILTFPEQ